jgi:Undecaprenyl-phosphate glucose phosphotransferase
LARRGGDLLGVALALGFAYWVRFASGFVFTPPAAEPLRAHLLDPLPVALVLAGISLSLSGLYRRSDRSPASEVWAVLRASGLAVLVILAATFLYRGESYSRIMATVFSVTLPVVLVTLRGLQAVGGRSLRQRGIGLRRVLLIGEEGSLAGLAKRLRRRRRDLELVGWVHTGAPAGSSEGAPSAPSEATSEATSEAASEPDPSPTATATAVAGEAPALPPCLGTAEGAELLAVLQAEAVDEVYLALPSGEHGRLEALDEVLTGVPVDVHLVADLGGCALIRPTVSSLGSVPVITLRQGPHVGLDALVKRVFDVVVGGAILALAAPVLLLVGLLVRLGSPGPALYRQERVGWGGRRFTIYKFRTMQADADRVGPTRTQRDDPRRTRLGALLRRTSLDELPQLLNVLRGDMSLVGPRPEPVGHYPELERELPGFMLRHSVPAGMTGWAQVHGLRGDAELSERLRYDLEYIHRWSIWFDLRILVLTALRGFVHPNAF